MKWALIASIVVVGAIGCGHAARRAPVTAPDKPLTLAERTLGMLPDGAQIVVELDFARLRANPVVGDVAKRALEGLSIDQKLPGIPVAAQGQPLAHADYVVLASYGVGTAQAATVTLIATKDNVPAATRLSPELVVIGPDEWVQQISARAAIAAKTPLRASEELLRLRDHAMPAEAPGAVLRVTAMLSFDARVAMARQIGIELAPAQLSVWADVVDDFAMIIDADAADPGDKTNKEAVGRMRGGLTAILGEAANEPALRVLGVGSSLSEARFIEQKTWVRAIIAIGPRHLGRVVERAKALLSAPS
jgi:hypothetical protein